MQKCPNCHNQVPDDADTCFVCGQELDKKEPTTPVVEDDKTLHKDNVLIIISFLIPILGLIFFMFFRTKNRPYANKIMLTTLISIVVYAIIFAYIRFTL